MLDFQTMYLSRFCFFLFVYFRLLVVLVAKLCSRIVILISVSWFLTGNDGNNPPALFLELLNLFDAFYNRPSATCVCWQISLHLC